MGTLVGSIGTVCNLMEEVQSEALLFSFSLFRHCVFGICQIGSEAENLCSFRHLDFIWPIYILDFIPVFKPVLDFEKSSHMQRLIQETWVSLYLHETCNNICGVRAPILLELIYTSCAARQQIEWEMECKSLTKVQKETSKAKQNRQRQHLCK